MKCSNDNNNYHFKGACGAQAPQDDYLVGLVFSWNSETRETANPSAMDEKATYLNSRI